MNPLANEPTRKHTCEHWVRQKPYKVYQAALTLRKITILFFPGKTVLTWIECEHVTPAGSIVGQFTVSDKAELIIEQHNQNQLSQKETMGHESQERKTESQQGEIIQQHISRSPQKGGGQKITEGWQAPVPGLPLPCRWPLGVLWPQDMQFVGRMETEASDTAWTVASCWLWALLLVLLGAGSVLLRSRLQEGKADPGSGHFKHSGDQCWGESCVTAELQACGPEPCPSRQQKLRWRQRVSAQCWWWNVSGHSPQHQREQAADLGTVWAPEKGHDSLVLGLQGMPGVTCWSWSRWRQHPYL